MSKTIIIQENNLLSHDLCLQIMLFNNNILIVIMNTIK